MLIGDPNHFAIECHHDPISNETQRVFGRMCIHTASGILGDVSEPSCMLNVTEGILTRVLGNLPKLNDTEVLKLSDLEAFDFLNRVLYLEIDRSAEELWQAHERYFKYDFLTQGGESFDRTKSFAILTDEQVRVIFTDHNGKFHSTHISLCVFRDVIQSFFAWLKKEGNSVPSV
jgi:hypothetical protein